MKKILFKTLSITSLLTLPIVAISCNKNEIELIKEIDLKHDDIESIKYDNLIPGGYLTEQNVEVTFKNKNAVLESVILNKVEEKDKNSTSSRNLTIKYKINNEIRTFEKNLENLFIKFDIQDIDSKNILEVANEADINLLFSLTGTGIWYNFIKLSLLSKGEIHLGRNFSYNGVHKLDVNEWNKFNHEYKKTPNKNSVIEEFEGKSDSSSVIPRWLEIIKANPNKKINIWKKVSIMDEEYLQLAKFPNVYIQSLEENPSMFESFEAKYQKSIEKNKDLLDKQSIENHLIQKGNMDIFADNSDFLLYGNIKDANMHSWWTSQDAYVFFKEKGIKNNHLFWGMMRTPNVGHALGVLICQ